MDFFSLPVELYYDIFKYLDYSDLLLSVSILDERMNSIVNSYSKFSRVKKISNFKHQRKLTYGNVDLSDERISTLFNALRYNKTIEHASIYLSERISNDELRCLSDAIQHNMHINLLDLHINCGAEMIYISPGIMKNKSIQSLIIYFDSRLYYLEKNLSGANDMASFLNCMSNVLENNQTLKSLDLSYLNIGNNVIQLIESLKYNRSIKFLNVKSTLFTIDKNFLNALARSNLDEIDASLNKIENIAYTIEWAINSKIELKYW